MTNNATQTQRKTAQPPKSQKISKETIAHMRRGFQRVFAMPITRSTFREIQSVTIGAVQQEKKQATMIFESFFFRQGTGRMV
jgi:hypothetical protein